ncbi:MFS transporter [Corynebacterium sp. LK19]|uniref:MFS transporter n=1 Tax=unclassified Corynebacterium TaxID=2624378 RepID=UPI0008C2E09A|nr:MULTISPECIES: MFS transporter [unclassified Corynebacterium]MBC6746891.1 MFS transporter [Corynebacterium sp. LK25]OFL71379.1 MFS transporter permease [Corynebacterium sp. HMSC063G05]OHR25040.1 MFS transporter permease [Corynebacterium sp. HMSC072B09]TXS86226.1 MFS transporter [Corynebacterium sp. LK10]OHR27849.1 MFS transporter permease [Corynebacterium sp. HMSC073B01]
MIRDWIRVALGMFAVAFGANLFAPLLPAYRITDALNQSQVTFLFAIYVAGLIPALLICGPLSDRLGRRAIIRPALITSAAGSVVLLTGVWFHFPSLLIGRLVVGISMGMVMAAGASWIKEIAPVAPQISARRATVALSAGFSLGPLASGLVAEFAPRPDVIPYLVHLALLLGITPLTWNASGGLPTSAHSDTPQRFFSSATLSPRFLWAVAAWAPWVFGAACTSFVVLPTIAESSYPIAFAGLIACITMGTGVLVQPLVTRISSSSFIPPAIFGLGLTTVGMLLSLIVALTQNVWSVFPAALTLGAAYGVMMVSGLREVQIIAPPAELGAATAIYYSLTYVGFFAPFVISFAAPKFGFVPVFVFGAIIAMVSMYPVAKVAQSAVRSDGAS